MISQSVRAAALPRLWLPGKQVVNRTYLPQESLSQLREAFKKNGVGLCEWQRTRAQPGGGTRHLDWLLEKPTKLAQTLSLPVFDIPAAEREQTIARLQQGANLKREQEEFAQFFEQLIVARQASFPARLQGRLFGPGTFDRCGLNKKLSSLAHPFGVLRDNRPGKRRRWRG